MPAALLRNNTRQDFCVQVARRVRSSEYLAAQQEAGKKRGKRALRYRACAVEGEVFLHPGTGVATAAPEFVVYMQLVQTAVRPYMRGEATPLPVLMQRGCLSRLSCTCCITSARFPLNFEGGGLHSAAAATPALPAWHPSCRPQPVGGIACHYCPP